MSTEYNPRKQYQNRRRKYLEFMGPVPDIQGELVLVCPLRHPLCGSGLFIPASSSPGVYTYRFGPGKRGAAQEPCCHDLWFYRFGYVRFAAKCG